MMSFKCGDCYEIPTLCHIEMTYKCNQNCIFCYNPRRSESINYSKLDRIVNAVAKAKIPHVYLSGGEPSMVDIDCLNKYIELLSKNSSVTVLTNGNKTLFNLNKKIACLGIPIHGITAEEHDAMTQIPGSFERMKKSIQYYISEGFDVRCILVLTGYNYDKMYTLIKIAEDLGMESVYIDRYEDGGIGATNSKFQKLKPTIQQFREALTQIIQARNDCKKLEGRVGFGTAIPFCIDSRLLTENIFATCGVGTSFCAINSDGDFRICNQSEIVFGNVLKEDIKTIWQKREINCFRDLDWVQEPCASCSALRDCVCGCKVDANYNDTFSIDYAVRNDMDLETRQNIDFINRNYSKLRINAKRDQIMKLPLDLETSLFKSPYLKINNETKDLICVTRYQTVLIDSTVKDMLEYIIQHSSVKLAELMQFVNDEKELIRVCRLLLYINAVSTKKLELVYHEA